MKSALFAALTVTVLLCSTGLSSAQKVPPSPVSPTTTSPPTLLPHFYTNHYATGRTTLKKLIDGTRAVIFFLGQQNASSRSWQVSKKVLRHMHEHTKKLPVYIAIA